jgi:hypothetical protein
MVVAGTYTFAQVAVLPLVAGDDPVKLSDAAFDNSDPSRPVVTLRLENTTKQALSTDQIWLKVGKFFTPAETQKNGDRIVSTCGNMARANHDSATQFVHPGASVPITFWIGPNCVLDPAHTHFFLVVERITSGKRFVDAVWQRDPADFARLLGAAMPHP